MAHGSFYQDNMRKVSENPAKERDLPSRTPRDIWITVTRRQEKAPSDEKKVRIPGHARNGCNLGCTACLGIQLFSQLPAEKTGRSRLISLPPGTTQTSLESGLRGQRAPCERPSKCGGRPADQSVSPRRDRPSGRCQIDTEPPREGC